MASVEDILVAVCTAVCPSIVTAGDVAREQKRSNNAYLRTSLSRLDAVLHGGLPAATITELAGPSGCGKTQTCLMLSVLTTLSMSDGGLDGGVLYIDTESAFSAERLLEIARNRYPGIFRNEEDTVKLSESVHVFTESTCTSLLKRLENIEDILIEKNIKLIVIDSIASLVRKEFDSRLGKNLIERTNLLAKQAAILKYTAESFKIPVVVTNQITTRFGSIGYGADRPETSLDGDGSYVTAALGNTWSHSVNTRLILQYMHDEQGRGGRRQILIAKSPVAPFAMFVYSIEDSGIILHDDAGADCYQGTDPGLQKITVRTSLPL